MREKICLIYNYAQHYRLGVFKLMDQQMECDFYFGDKMSDVKKLDYNELKGFKKELKNVPLFSNFYWQKGAVSLFFKDYKKYIILGEYYCLSTWLILFFSIFSSKKVYLWSHGWYGKESFVIKLIKKIFFSMATGIFLYGEYAKKLMIKEGFKPSKLYVIYNSLNYKEQIGIRKKLIKSDIYPDHFENKFPVLIFIGRLTKVKKLHYILEAQKKLREQGLLLNLVIIGNGEEKEFLSSKVLEYGLKDYVWFVGQLYEENAIAEYIFNADLCISPGNVGLTAMHTLMYGTPVITHNNFALQMPEFEALTIDKTGDFFEHESVSSLAIKIHQWFQKDLSREEIRENCYHIIDKKFNPDFQVSEIKKVMYGY
ncbi:glycosyltransferase family 1 protein [Chryseobacterium flavum]|uniref:Glycosyltransferase family 1 protein n=1 Tax=Chryseobacterium flavum TaxID=415851 RepID=A0A3D9CIT5_9FLAO|nr:glycosyltransferase [Chryseobacterium flavum]REC65635.1 glycosyltransferase family 1 protein [Chryseobacterium flavum]